MKTLKFKSNLVARILDDSKTTTWRLFDDKNLRVGDKLEFINSDTKESFSCAEIIDVREKKLNEIEELDYKDHEKYSNTKDMVNHYQIYYGQKVSSESIVKIIKFRLL